MSRVGDYRCDRCGVVKTSGDEDALPRGWVRLFKPAPSGVVGAAEYLYDLCVDCLEDFDIWLRTAINVGQRP